MPRTKMRFRNLYNVKQPPQWIPTIKLGKFKADNITLFEAAINDVVLRIKLEECIKKKAKEKRVMKRPGRDITSNPLKVMIQRSFRSKILDENNGHKAARTKQETKNNLLDRKVKATSTKPEPTNNLVDRKVKATSTKPEPKNNLVDRRAKAASTKPKIKNNHVDRKPKAPHTKPEETNDLTGCIPKPPNRYFLQFASIRHHSESNMVNVSFKKLSEMVCTMRLPSSSWKVTVVMNKSSSSVFQFSNAKPARIVAFSENGPSYKIVMDGAPVTLLGCPQSVDTIRDIELLLDIVNSLSLKDCMVLKL